MKKIAVFLPIAYRGGTLRMAKSIVKSIWYNARQEKENVKIIFSCIKDKYDLNEDFMDLDEIGVEVRETEWKIFSKEQVSNMFNFINKDLIDVQGNYFIPSDGMNFFMDCDSWLVISDRLIHPIIPLKDYGVVVFDYLQRYIPGIFDEIVLWKANSQGFIPLVRGAKKVFCTTPSTEADIISYAGVPKERVHLTSFFLDHSYINNKIITNNKSSNYLVWITNYSAHKNHLTTLKGIVKYYTEYEGQLPVVLIGWDKGLLALDNKNYEHLRAVPHLKKCIEYIEKNRILLEKIEFRDELTDQQYIEAVADAQFMLHANLNDNGTFCVIEAAYVGTPSLSSQYPAMEYINNIANLNMVYFDQFSPINLAEKLKFMEKNSQNIKLPNREFLNSLDWKANSKDFYDILKSTFLPNID